MIGRGIGVAILLAFMTAGCATVPPLHEDAIAISEIVQRVKCEIAYAVPEPRGPWPTGPYQWMRSWTAKVDLTLITNEQSSITPSASFIRPLNPQTLPGVGTFARNFTFGIAGGVSTTAVRTELLSFSVSLAELRKWKRRGDCNLPDGLDLYGNLGLKEWVASALGPVEFRQLTVGNHSPPGGKRPPLPSVRPPQPRIENLIPCGPETLEPLNDDKALVEQYAAYAEKIVAKARIDGANNNIQATYDDADSIYGAQEAAAAAFRKTQKDAASIIQLCPALKPQADIIVAAAKAAAARADTAKADVDTIRAALPRDPPIDSLSHSVQFIVAVSGSVAPSWTLVHFKGPGAGGNLAAASHSSTHTLNISMGSPSELPSEQARQLQNLVIIQNLSPMRAPQ